MDKSTDEIDDGVGNEFMINLMYDADEWMTMLMTRG